MIYRRRFSSIVPIPYKRQLSISPNPNDQNPSQIISVNDDSQLTTFAFCSNALKDTAKKGSISQAKQLHSHVMKFGFYNPLSVQNQILHAYIKCGEYYAARQLFDEMPVKNVVSWNTIICGVVSCGRSFDGVVYFRRMLVDMVKPDCLTFNGLIRASTELNNLALGNQLHGFVLKCGFDSNSFVGCALIDLYAAYGFVREAWFVFDGIKCRDLVLWNVMVSCYGANHLIKDAMKVFGLMCIGGFSGDEFTFSSLLSSCAIPGYCELGKQIHGIAVKLSFDLDLQVVSAIVDMYAKNQEIIDARKVFDGLVVRNVVSWNTMIVGYGQNGDGKEAMKLLVQMLQKDLKPDELTLASIISSCSNLSFFNEVHCYAVKTGFKTHLSIANALIVAYSKCGKFESALKSFKSVEEPDLITWTSILGAYGFHGRAMESVEAFETMLSIGVKPDDLAFLAVISSCSHGGLTSKGLYYFKLMITYYSIVPKPEHYACLVDLLGRSGLVDEAYIFLTSFPSGLDPNSLRAILGACKLHGHMKLAELIAEKLFEMEPKSPVNYTLMSNMYASIGHWYDAAMTRKSCLCKHSGCSIVMQG